MSNRFVSQFPESRTTYRYRQRSASQALTVPKLPSAERGANTPRNLSLLRFRFIVRCKAKTLGCFLRPKMLLVDSHLLRTHPKVTTERRDRSDNCRDRCSCYHRSWGGKSNSRSWGDTNNTRSWASQRSDGRNGNLYRNRRAAPSNIRDDYDLDILPLPRWMPPLLSPSLPPQQPIPIVWSIW